MGLIRVILAMAVFFGHMAPRAFGFHPIDGVTAVKSFYVISGFYMSLILSERPEYQATGTFLRQRWLRIWPAYLVVLVFTAIVQAATLPQTFQGLRFLPLMMVVLANIFLFGQDWLFFFGKTSDGGLEFQGAFQNQTERAYTTLLLPQSWTLGIELTFYLLVPFVHRLKTMLIAVLLAALLALKWHFRELAVEEPFDYRFFPFELPLFIYGFLAHRFYALVQSRPLTGLAWPVYLAMLMVVLFGQYLPFWQSADLPTAVPMLLAVSCPLIFLLTRRWKWDQKLGEFSYPIYLVHILAIVTGGRYLLPMLGLDKLPLSAEHNIPAQLVITAVVIFLSWLLIRFVAEPIDRYRAKKR